MTDSKNKIQHLKDEINAVKRDFENIKTQTQNKIINLEFEIVKLENATLCEYVDNNFVNSCISFNFKNFGRKQFTLSDWFGVKDFVIPVEVEYIDDNKKVIILGIKENNDVEKKKYMMN